MGLKVKKLVDGPVRKLLWWSSQNWGSGDKRERNVKKYLRGKVIRNWLGRYETEGGGWLNKIGREKMTHSIFEILGPRWWWVVDRKLNIWIQSMRVWQLKQESEQDYHWGFKWNESWETATFKEWVSHVKEKRCENQQLG